MESTGIADILAQIVARRRQRIAEVRGQESFHPPAGQAELLTPADNRFLAALAERRGRAVIAEVKMGSPSLGSLAQRFEPLKIARSYADNGAAALSVVVEPDHFHGSYELLAACHEACGLPALAKDFVVDPVQFHWAQRAGASAVLLIAALYSRDELLEYARLARRMGLVPLIETHDLADLSKLEGSLWELVGVNNRDLRTFDVEIGTSLALLHSLPPGAVKVAESGIASAADRSLLSDAGYDAFLIGSALLTAADPAAKLGEILGQS